MATPWPRTRYAARTRRDTRRPVCWLSASGACLSIQPFGVYRRPTAAGRGPGRGAQTWSRIWSRPISTSRPRARSADRHCRTGGDASAPQSTATGIGLASAPARFRPPSLRLSTARPGCRHHGSPANPGFREHALHRLPTPLHVVSGGMRNIQELVTHRSNRPSLQSIEASGGAAPSGRNASVRV